MTTQVNHEAGNEIKVGQHYVFRYWFPGSNSTAPELNKRHGQRCLVYKVDVEHDPDDPESEAILLVRFPDGYEGSAFASELEDSDVLMTPHSDCRPDHAPQAAPEPHEMTAQDWATVESLRARGFAVAIFNPREIGDLVAKDVEQAMVSAGNNHIDILDPEEHDDDDPQP